MNENTSLTPPHHKLIAFQVASQLLVAVRSLHLGDAHLNDQIKRSARSICLNIGEGAGKVTRADQNRSFAIARGEATELYVALEVAVLEGLLSAAVVTPVLEITARTKMLLSGLLRRR